MQFMLCRDNVTQVGNSELLEQWRNYPDSWIWVDLYQEPSEEEHQFLVENFNLDDLVITEAQRDRHPDSALRTQGEERDRLDSFLLTLGDPQPNSLQDCRDDQRQL